MLRISLSIKQPETRPVLRRTLCFARRLVRKKTAFRHSKGAFQTCEFCNICRHLIAKSKSLDDNDPDKLTPDAIQLVAEMMVLHRAKQGNFLFHPFALLPQFSPD